MSGINSECFAKNLKRLIKKNNIKNIDLADYLGLSKSAVSNYLSAVSIPKVEILSKIAEFFDVTMESLVKEKYEELSSLSFNENDKAISKIPLFHKTLSSADVIYRNENYMGLLTSPLHIDEELDCYGTLTYDDFMCGYGIPKRSLVVFSSSTEVTNGEIGAVFIKSERKIVIRSILSDNKKITLNSDNGSEVFEKTKGNCDAVILGKVVFATFYPNK